MKLDNEALIPCTQFSSALSKDEANSLVNRLNGWYLIEKNGIQIISRHFTFKNYLSALEFASSVASLAEQEDHHPRICIEWGKVTIDWWTHSINGLFINDFIMAARCERIFSELK